MSEQLTDEQRLAVIREIWEQAAKRQQWTPIHVVFASYEREVTERLKSEGKA